MSLYRVLNLSFTRICWFTYYLCYAVVICSCQLKAETFYAFCERVFLSVVVLSRHLDHCENEVLRTMYNGNDDGLRLLLSINVWWTTANALYSILMPTALIMMIIMIMIITTFPNEIIPQLFLMFISKNIYLRMNARCERYVVTHSMLFKQKWNRTAFLTKFFDYIFCFLFHLMRIHQSYNNNNNNTKRTYFKTIIFAFSPFNTLIAWSKSGNYCPKTSIRCVKRVFWACVKLSQD